MQDCIFCKIVNKKINAPILYEDEKTIAFNDIHPVAPIHILVIPKKHIADFHDVDSETAVAIINTLHRMIDDKELMGKGYRVEVNGGGAQAVGHLHFHLIAPVKKPQE